MVFFDMNNKEYITEVNSWVEKTSPKSIKLTNLQKEYKLEDFPDDEHLEELCLFLSKNENNREFKAIQVYPKVGTNNILMYSFLDDVDDLGSARGFTINEGICRLLQLAIDNRRIDEYPPILCSNCNLTDYQVEILLK